MSAVMIVSGSSLSLLGRSALTNVSGARASSREAPEPVEPTDPLKDPTSSEYQELQDLKQRDREVRQHEQAHIAAGGQYVRGGATYTYEQGPDGRQYVIGGEVKIDSAPVPDDPAATISKMQVVRRAALAPAEPSAQDRRVAAEASRTEVEARIDLREQQREENAADGEAGSEIGGLRQRVESALDAYRGAADGSNGAAPTPALDLIA